MVTDKQLERLRKNKDEAIAAFDKAYKEYEEEVRNSVWDVLKPHIITRADALEFKKAIDNESIIEVLFKKALLPDEIMEAISRKRREEKYKASKNGILESVGGN